MNKKQQWLRLTHLTQLKYDMAANELKASKRKDAELAQTFQNLQSQISQGMQLSARPNDLGSAEINKIRWRRLMEGQQARLNTQRLEVKIEIEQNHRQLAKAAGQRDVSLKTLERLKKEAAMRLAAPNQ